MHGGVEEEEEELGNGDGVRTRRLRGKVFIEMKNGKESNEIGWFLFGLRGGLVFGD